uniref:putative B3 domain-containing protein At4g03170 n=1 Tax=Fragaria vesca subsp. vesca TaxID=101020 RepID=UPI0005CA3E50|nr:PREDICTED: putative B3 domain-containing protein At4g03170 [Fragaria vesca subsp. vesca]
MISLTDEQDIKAAFNLCFMKHKIIDSEEEIQKLEDTKLKSLGQTSKYPNAEAKPSAQEIRKKEEFTVNLQLGLKRKAVQVEAMYVAQAAKPHEGLFYGNYTPPNLPPVPSLHQFIGICSEPFEKQLTPSDVRDGQSRLAMSKEYVQKRLMPLLNENEDLNEGIDVMTYDLAGKEYPMKFRTWVSKIHVLTAGWKAFRKDHKLVENQHWVTVWMFRNIATGKLCFVIEVRKLPVFDAIKRRRTRQN